MSVWERVRETVDAHTAHDDLSVAIQDAASLFEKVWIAPEQKAGAKDTSDHGWSPEVAGAPVDLDAREELIDSLKRLASVRPDDGTIASVYWALGKVRESSLRDFFIEGLRQQLNRPHALYQVMVALQALGEPVFQGKTSTSIENVAENVALAESYLATLND